MGTIGGFIYGAGTPLAGLFFGKVLVALSPQDVDIIKKDGLRWSLYHLGIAVLGGVSIFLKTWKLESLGSNITSKMRKRVFKKYLELDLQFYDQDMNSPGSLLTKLSISFWFNNICNWWHNIFYSFRFDIRLEISFNINSLFTIFFIFYCV